MMGLFTESEKFVRRYDWMAVVTSGSFSLKHWMYVVPWVRPSEMSQ